MKYIGRWLLLDQQLRTGQRSAVQLALAGLDGAFLADLSPVEKVQVGALFRRAGMYTNCLRLLRGRVYANEIQPEPFDPEFAMQYASSLAELGAPREALRIFDRVDLKNQDWYFLRALGELHLRKYSSAKRNFENAALKAAPDDFYFHSLMQLNSLFCESYLQLWNPEFESRLLELIQNARAKKLVVVEKGATEILARILFESKNRRWTKWVEDSGAASDFALQPMWRVRQAIFEGKAVSRADLNTLNPGQKRELCLFRGIYHDDKGALAISYVGTPFEEFRAWQKLLMARHSLGDSADYFLRECISRGHFELNSDGWRARARLPAKTAVWSLKNGSPMRCLDEGKIVQRAYQVFSGDFFSSPRWTEIFDQIYEDENLDLEYSGLKTRQVLFRLRRELARSGNIAAPVIQCAKDRFKMVAAVPVFFKAEKNEDASTEILRGLGAQFTRKDLENKMHPRSAQRLIAGWLQKGLVKKQGSGPTIKYCVV